jgi:decaprenylphospho-beta-D-erythro-pentofuranosid-2-ulose 2-reductase
VSNPPSPAHSAGRPTQNVLILGATSSIAQATARLLAAEGARLFLVARSPLKLEAVASDLQTRGAAQVIPYVLDLDDTARHPAMLAAAAETLGAIDLALLAHGVLGDQAAAEADFDRAAQVLYTNFLAPVSLITWLANYFSARGTGCLAVIGSVAGDRGRKSNYVYGASKGALDIFLDGVRARVDRLGVHVLTIKPGFVRTPMTAHLPPSPLFAQPGVVGRGILQAVRSRRDVAYLPGFWALIMFAIRAIPRRVFKGMNL